MDLIPIITRLVVQMAEIVLACFGALVLIVLVTGYIQWKIQRRRR